MLTRRELFRQSGRAALAVTVAPVLTKLLPEPVGPVWRDLSGHGNDAWSPADIPGLQVWYSNEDGWLVPEKGGMIEIWYDRAESS